MSVNNHSILAALLILFLCFQLASPYQTFACHASCNNCTNTVTDYYYTCRNSGGCAYGFTGTGSPPSSTVSNCTPASRYTAVYNQSNITILETTTGSPCVNPFYTSISLYGEFDGTTSVKLWSSATLLPHYYVIRVIASIVFKNWNLDSNYISILFNSTSKKNLTYGSMPNLASGK